MRRGHARAAGIAVGLACGVFLTALAAALTAAGVSYSWRTSMLSDLGNAWCHLRDGRWVCSPRSEVFNAGLVAAGGLLLAGAVAARGPWGRLLALTVAAMGAGLMLLGAFPADVHGGAHMTGVVLALPVTAGGVMVSGLSPATAWLQRLRRTRAVVGAATLLLCLLHLLPQERTPPRGATEVLIVAALVAVLVVESARLLRAADVPRPSG